MTHRQTNAFSQVLHSVKSDQYVEDATSTSSDVESDRGDSFIDQA